MSGRFITEIRRAVKNGRLREPFTPDDVRRACPGFAPKTYNTFLPKHRRGNPGDDTELFERVRKGLYRLLD